MFQVCFYKGDYRDRQINATHDRCICYFELHLNSSENAEDNYTLVSVGSNADVKTKRWAKYCAMLITNEFDTPRGGLDGMLVGGINGRSEDSLIYASMPAIFAEPLFSSNPLHAEWIKNGSGQNRLARAITKSIMNAFPNGGTVAFSIGHRYQESNPFDNGVRLYGGGYEAEYCEIILKKAAAQLSKITYPMPFEYVF